jgi:rubrerythrin
MTLRDEIVQIIFKDWVDHVDLNDTADSILALINEERCEWLNPTWVCNVCGHVEYEEREVLCWDCGEGEMIYQPRCSKKIEVKNA